MKLYGWFIIIIALGLAVFNAIQMDFDNPSSENSKVALIGIVTSFCAILLTLIYMRSKKVAKQVEQNTKQNEVVLDKTTEEIIEEEV